MRFNRSDVPGELPVKELLEERVGKAVAERFAVEEIRVFAKPLETELTRRLAALQKRPHVLEVKSLPLRDGGRREEVTYRIIFDIAGVDERGWHVFRSKSFSTIEEEVGQIKEILREDVRGLLDTVPSEYLQYSDIKVKRQLEDHRSCTGAEERIPRRVRSAAGVVTATTKNDAAAHARVTGVA